MEGEKKHLDSALDAIAIDKIDHFLKPKRRAKVFAILAKGIELSQKDLAEAMDSTATALSNILVVFQNFDYKLLEFSSVGKYRFYKLSPLGESYLNAKIGSSSSDRIDCDGEKQKLIHEAKAAVDKIIQLLPAPWEVILARLLEVRIYGRDSREVKRKFELEDEDFEKTERALNQYLTCVELAELQSSNAVLDQVLDLLLPHMILRNLISDIVDVFSQFSPVINALGDEKKSIGAYLILKNAFSTPNYKEVEDYAGLLDWGKKTFDGLQETAVELTKNVSHMDNEGEVCRYFLNIFPGQCGLCMYIARCICGDR